MRRNISAVSSFLFSTFGCLLCCMASQSLPSSVHATTRNCPFHYFRSAFRSVHDPRILGDMKNPEQKADLLTALLEHEAQTVARVNGSKGIYLACSSTYSTGTEVQALLMEHFGPPEPIHSSRSDDTVCYFAYLASEETNFLARSNVFGVLVPYPSALKVRNYEEAKINSDNVEPWIRAEDHVLTVIFAPKLKEIATELMGTKHWLRKRLQYLKSDQPEEDFFFTSRRINASFHDNRFGSGSVARAWSGVARWAHKKDQCSYEEALTIKKLSPGRATIYGHHLLGSRISEDPDVHRSCVNRLMLALATAPDVLHVEIEALRYKSSNMAAARLVQAGGSDNTAQPLWDAGLNGAGQVIQIGDTGVDQYHCMFHDDDTGIVATSAFSGTVVTDLSKRKVVQYLVGEYGDSYDCAAENGHGTHVAASAAGGFSSTYTVSVSDTCSSTSDTDGVLGCKVPDYYANCLDHLDKCRDDNFGGYSGTLAFACDQTCYCSANRAEKYVGARGKNCEEMILDSSGTAPKAKIAVADYTSSDMCSSGSMGFASEDLYSYYFPNFYVIDDQARISSNSWGISSCDGAYDSSCYYVDKYIWETQDFSVFFAAGNDGYSCGSNPSVVSPATSKNGIAVGASETGRWPVNGESATNDPDTLAYFSGIGLTEDGRFKPDIVAPGYYVVSANSSGYQSSASCSVTYMQGTSMSTPIAAGGGALIRQYFVNGHYAKHTKDISQTYSSYECLSQYTCHNKSYISSSLVKAIMLNGATPMWNRFESDGTFYDLATPPSKEQGFGRLAIEYSLPVIESSLYTGGNALFVDDNRTGLVSGERKSYYWSNLQNSGMTQRALLVTLAWTDPPNEGYYTASKQLLHDLDLIVQCLSTGQIWYGNGGTTADQINNVEKVNISSPMACSSKWNITVVANTLVSSVTQSYALVISGAGLVLGSSESTNSIASPTKYPTKRPTVAPSFSPASISAPSGASDTSGGENTSIFYVIGVLGLGSICFCMLVCGCVSLLRNRRPNPPSMVELQGSGIELAVIPQPTFIVSPRPSNSMNHDEDILLAALSESLRTSNSPPQANMFENASAPAFTEAVQINNHSYSDNDEQEAIEFAISRSLADLES